MDNLKHYNFIDMEFKKVVVCSVWIMDKIDYIYIC